MVSTLFKRGPRICYNPTRRSLSNEQSNIIYTPKQLKEISNRKIQEKKEGERRRAEERCRRVQAALGTAMKNGSAEFPLVPYNCPCVQDMVTGLEKYKWNVKRSCNDKVNILALKPENESAYFGQLTQLHRTEHYSPHHIYPPLHDEDDKAGIKCPREKPNN